MSAAMQNPVKFNPLGPLKSRNVTARATHNVSRTSHTSKARRVNRNTLDQIRMPEDQWVPVKETILVKSKFLREEPKKDDNSLNQFSNSSAQRFWKTLQDIDEEGSAANKWPRGEWLSSLVIAGACGMLSFVSDPTTQAIAEEVEATAAKASPGELGGTEAAILVAPVIIYAGFTVYRKANPRADVGNFLLGIVSFAIFANIFAIAVFKIRLF
ncbi:hypothetical protein BSKO_13849 [Bryopsis sp. KO-2023]|nr:hypothetical protein BSKO_13849 [Bryopsis sp. KO-2023]